MSVRMVVRIQRAQKRAGDVAKVDLGEECGHRRERGTVLCGRVFERLLAKKPARQKRSGHSAVRLCGAES